MNSIGMKATVVLTVLLISLVSISTALGLQASTDSYKGQCGVELSIPAPGILKNDVQNPSLVKVVNPELITIDQKYGTILVNPDGSFVYDVPENIGTSALVTFTYTISDGKTVSNSATAKISVSCRCHGAAPDVTVCLGTPITRDLLMSEGAGCFGCDSTGVWDLSKIPAQPEAGKTYTYTVSCPGCSVFTGHVTIVGPCTITTLPFTVCEGIVPTSELILANGAVTCSCDDSPVISNIVLVNGHWEYTITCQSECGPTTGTGIVNIEPPCVPTSEPFTICSEVTPTATEILDKGNVECGSGVCDTTPAISNIVLVGDHWEYTITCTTALGCIATDTGIVNIETPCAPTWDLFTVCEGTTPTAAEILAKGNVECGSGVCDTTPVISDITLVEDGFDYTITCTTANGCISTVTGHVDVCVIEVVGFDVDCDNPPLSLTPADIIELGQVRCVGCTDNTPGITDVRFVEVVNQGEVDEYELWEYTITCNGCTVTGQFNNFCLLPGPCTPVAPNICGCTASPVFPLDLIPDGSCGTDETITMANIDDSQVNYAVPNEDGEYYTYTLTCFQCPEGPTTVTGRIRIVPPLDGECVFTCC